MIRLELNREQVSILREALDSYLSDLRMEIADTDRKDFREQLKRKKEILLQIRNQLQEENAT